MIQVRSLQKSFGSVQAVQNVSFSAQNGQITGILGPNGAGKSTTLRMVYGLLHPDRGRCDIDGIFVERNPIEARKKLGVLPDAQGLYPRLTARENIRYFARLQGLKGIESRITELSNLLAMNDFIDRRVEGFSQGQRMKVAIGRAIVHQPANIVLDEPTNGLDVVSTRSMRSLISSLKERGHCVLFSSHMMQEVEALCDHVVIIVRGHSVFEGSLSALRAHTKRENLEEAFVSLISQSTS
ncbi:MAG: ATP-binding cassette domain-containing protein [Myxococcota bacterium]|nr:ATP-binding cassette domain-containing protein [Myxococcota bacterium]